MKRSRRSRAICGNHWVQLHLKGSRKLAVGPQLLLREPDPGSELSTDTVRKIAEVVACQVILEISWIEVICHIENLYSQMRSVLVEATRETDSLQHLHIERNECRKATSTISWADEVAIFIDEREREPGSYVENGRPR